MLNHLQELGIKTWAYHVRQLLCRDGFGAVWLQQNVRDTNKFLAMCRQRLSDQFQQDWHTSIESKDQERFELYASFKQIVTAECCLAYNQLQRFKETYMKGLEYKLYWFIKCVTKKMSCQDICCALHVNEA